MSSILTDTYGRTHNYLRISLTDNCNLRCFYCMPDEDYAFSPASKLMQLSEIETLAKLFVENGVTKIRLTGGEPLIRKDAPEIIHSLSLLPAELTMTTNGIMIDKTLSTLISAGFSSINVSLDTLNPEKFYTITRRDYFQRVRDNIDLLLENNIKTKINVVVMKGLNEDEILDFAEFTKRNPVEVRFIEFMPFSGNRWTSNKVYTLDEIICKISSVYDLKARPRKPNDTSKPFEISGHAGTISVISTMSAPFCSDCNRIRLTADGKLKNCLFSTKETDLLSTLREGGDVLPLVQKSIGSKAFALGGQFSSDFQNLDAEYLKNRSMITIGG